MDSNQLRRLSTLRGDFVNVLLKELGCLSNPIIETIIQNIINTRETIKLACPLYDNSLPRAQKKDPFNQNLSMFIQ